MAGDLLSKKKCFRNEGDDQPIQRGAAQIHVIPVGEVDAVDTDEGAALLQFPPHCPEELIPLFETFANQDEYKAGLKEVNANTEEEVSALAELNDAVGKLKGNFDTLETNRFYPIR